MATTPSVPFSDTEHLERFFTERLYSRDPTVALPATFDFYGVSSLDELMGTPARTNSGALGTMGSCWFGLFPFVDMATQWVEVDAVGTGADGCSVLFWGRWNGECVGNAALPNGETVELAGKSFRDLRYSYRLSFSPDTSKATLFEGLFDVAEWGRLMGSTEFAKASATTPIYPT